MIQQIFDWSLAGENVLGIVKRLEEQHIPSPRGKNVWAKRTVDTMLSNEKYHGDVILKNEVDPFKHTMSSDIISQE